MTINPRVFELTPDLEPIVVPPAGPPYLLRSSDQINLIVPAVEGVHSLIELIKQSAVNPAFKSQYSTFTDALSGLKEPLKAHKVFNTFSIQSGPDAVSGCLIVTHVSGQWIASSELTLPLGKKDIHGYKSAITYLKRILVESFWALAGEEDDDGNRSLGNVPTAYAPKGEITIQMHLDEIERCSSNELLDGYYASLPEKLKKASFILDACIRRRAKLTQDSGDEI